MRGLLLLAMLAVALSLAACGSGAAPSQTQAAGDAAAGETVYNEVAVPACGTCHSLEAGQVLVGPSLAGVGSAAGSRVSGLSADDYLLQSIMEPDVHLVEGFAAGLMPKTYATQLNEKQIQDLVAYMLTLK